MTMRSKRILAIAVLALFGGVSLGVEMVGVDGSSIQYATPIVSKIGSKDVKLVLTGTALRKKLFFNVYTIGSYLQEGIRVGSAEELAMVNAPKQLHLVMERDVTGADMADAFRSAIRMNYPAPTFEREVNMLADYMRANPIKRGDQVWLTHVAGVGLHVKLPGSGEMTIDNPAFPAAVWNIYLGRNNLGEHIKRGLCSRL